MDFGAKVDRLREEKGWSLNYLCRLIGTTNSQYIRWRDWSKSNECREEFAALRSGRTADTGGEPKTRGSHPSRVALIRLADAFDVDLRWLIDDNQGWEARPVLVGHLAERVKKLSPKEAQQALELLAAAKAVETKKPPESGK